MPISRIAAATMATSTTSDTSQISLPEIKPNRRFLDNRFPVLGFTLRSDRAGFYEVLLATDRTLFDAANAGRRSAANFYSSRQNSKLIPLTGQAVYLVPTAILKGFAAAQSGAFEIFYVAITYDTADGRDPVFSIAPNSLTATAPSVTVAASFRGYAIPTAFGLSLHGRAHSANGASSRATVRSASFAIDPAEDRGEGEDGGWVGALEAVTRQPAPRRSSNGLTPARATDYDDRYADGYDDNDDDNDDARGQYFSRASSAALDYCDGYEGAAVRTQETEFSTGSPEPSPLKAGAADDDDDDNDGPGPTLRPSESPGMSSAPAAKSAAVYATASYGDESDEWDLENLPPYQPLGAAEGGEGPQLTIETRRDLIRKLGEYSATVADGEYEGDYGKKHPAYHHYHLGLSYGVLLFNQDAGHLGRLLSMMKERDTARFSEIFGDGSDVLLKVTNAEGPPSKDSPGGRSARVQPVNGADLWQQPWLSLFQQAGDERAFQAAQNQLASILFLDPMLRFAKALGFRTERLLAALVTCASAMGMDNAKQWIVNTVSPVQTPAQRQQALAALQQKDILSFQKATPQLQATGHWDADTQAAIISALRGLADHSPLPVPSADQMLAALIRRSGGTPWMDRLQHVKDANELADAALDF